MIFVLWKGLLGFGLPIAFAARELYLLRQERLKDEAKAAALAAGTSREPEGEVPPAIPAWLRRAA
jgi:hypothetical protein